jgi:DNA helicase TIP49 (TBP-interacting protein)
MFSSREALTQGLRNSGYIVDSVTANTVHLASALHKPVLLEGPAGSGKTQLAYAVAEATPTAGKYEQIAAIAASETNIGLTSTSAVKAVGPAVTVCI